jgi:hypothetical protein
VQLGRNNPPVKKGSKAYCKSFLPCCLAASLLLPSCTSRNNQQFSMKAALTIGTIEGTNIEIRQEVEAKN